MRYLSIDQSLSSSAVIVWEDGVVIHKTVVRTGSTSSKGKQKKNVLYFDKEVEQMGHICRELSTLIQQFDIKHFVLESLSLGSVGSATRTLAGLFYCINYMLLLDMFPLANIHTIAPTKLKAYARQFLPLEEQEAIGAKGKKIKVKMDKKLMVRVVNILDQEVLAGYNQSLGATDMADAYLLGKLWYEEQHNE